MSEFEQVIQQVEEVPAVASAGRMLEVAREGAGLSVEEVAAQLRLSVRQVQALEADDSSALPGSMFVRGFIRNYARLLGLDAETLLAAYRVSVPDSGARAISIQSENIPIVSRDKKVWLPYVVASAIIGLALGGWMIYMEYFVGNSHQPVAEKVATEKSVAAVAPVAPVGVAPEVVAPMLSQAPSAMPAVPEMKATEPVAAQTQLAAGKLVMSFSEQSWVSVTDRDGKEIFNKSQPAGSQGAVEGLPPFNIVIGNATGVKLAYNDKSIDLAPYVKANVARLTLE